MPETTENPLFSYLKWIEEQSNQSMKREELVRIVCEQFTPIIQKSPLLCGIRRHLAERKQLLLEVLQDLERGAVDELCEVFSKIKSEAGQGKDPDTLQKIETVEHFISLKGCWHNPTPLYWVLRDELIHLLRRMPGDQATKESLVTLVRDAHSVFEADQMRRNILEKDSKELAMIWGDFEEASHYWSTSEFYLEASLQPRIGEDTCRGASSIGFKRAWQEIIASKDKAIESRTPVMFTDGFLLNGLQRLSQSFLAYIGAGSPAIESDPRLFEWIEFELLWDSPALIVKVTFENGEIEEFCTQKFNEGGEGKLSRIGQFVVELLSESGAGERQIDLLEGETVTRHVNRMRLPATLKRRFFLGSRGAICHFGGTHVLLRPNAETKEIIEKLRKTDRSIRG